MRRDDAYGRIRDLVVHRALEPEAPLSERGLAETLGLGRTPVREALRALVRDGLLVVHPMRGTFVRQLSFEDLREIHEMRLGLEGLAAYLAACRGPTPELDRCTEALRCFDGVADLDVLQAQEAGWAFHEALFRAADNSRLTAAYEALRAQSGLALRQMPRYSADRTRAAVREHLDIYAAVAARDPDVAQQRMWRHLAVAFDARLQALGVPVRPQPIRSDSPQP
ncbi:GntR family transcriptional regulator [Rhodoplanes sp. TEM]|uniref:GntR family transcriptional regulator n=1 Tax=Rhodoplanes tepidamans TaxID=200616 RepID=A0ABT5JIN4_RHOTP|nr:MULTISPECIES: GntR family transcriptional regulator [Rhodoplanes]MDC7789461.1 GntR family transcriptional regulator [Rhodoplanes tepidamans]MDC7986992.1 GntR family transcriptional regulator [Rhodoplanes sp. TEM]MDQ0359024.1 DNA-binding GntR family transcriptional regulator [Rhodoplanes tepidamans]